MATSSQPLVSVITAFFNEEAFLNEAIESVLLQNYENWELLLVDDGSTNLSTEIAKSYAIRYPDKIFYLEHKDHANMGVCASRNIGVKQAKGKLVAFLDADDVWTQDKLNSQVTIFLQHDISMLVEASAYWFEASTDHERLHIVQVGAPQNKVYQPSELVQYLYPVGKGAAPCPSGILITKEAIIKVCGFEESFNGEYQLYEDQAFLMKIYLHEKVYVSSACHNKYRQRKGSCVQRVHNSGNYHKVRRYFLEWMEVYLKKNNISEKAVHYNLQKALMPYRHSINYFFFSTLPAKFKRMLKLKIKKLTLS